MRVLVQGVCRPSQTALDAAKREADRLSPALVGLVVDVLSMAAHRLCWTRLWLESLDSVSRLVIPKLIQP